MRRPLVIGVGQRWRGDDAEGPRLVELLKGSMADLADFLVIEGDPLELLDHWEGRSCVVIIDAYEDSRQTGEVRHWCLSPQTAMTAQDLPFVTGGFSSHLVGLPETLRLGEALGRNPSEIHLLGIPAKNFALAQIPPPSTNGGRAAMEKEVMQRVMNILNRGVGSCMSQE